MKILALADLHVYRKIFLDIQRELRGLIKKSSPDVIVIAGDICENEGWMSTRNEFYIFLNEFEIPTIFCLGNHDFYNHTIDETLKHQAILLRNKNFLHCLDLEEFVDINNIRFVGNVLWYDGSLANWAWDGKISPLWRDREIVDFNPMKENHACIQSIKKSMNGYNGKSVLITHCVPWQELNLFQKDGYNQFNVYSGMSDLFAKENLSFDFAICGHTHREIQTDYKKDNKNIGCINVGNDYFHTNHFINAKLIQLPQYRYL